MNLSKTILVTGSSGLIGSAVVKQLIDKNYRVVTLDLVPNEIKHSNIILEITSALENLDIAAALADIKIDTLIHCAAHPGGKSLAEPTLDVEVNAAGGMKLFEWAARNKTEVIFLSSSAIYGKQDDHPINEKSDLNPNTVYAVCKMACENFLPILEEGYGLKWTVLRLFATYGAGHKPSKFQGIINILMTQMLEGNKIVVKGSLQRKRGLVEVQDAAQAIVKAVDNSLVRGQVVNISHGKVYTIHNLIEIIAKKLNKSIGDFEIIEQEGTIGDTFYNYADVTKARNLLGFEAMISLEQGVEKMLQQRLNHRG